MGSRLDTKLSSFCEALMEAAWLACLIVTPLLFDVRSNGVFESDKAVIVRSLAVVMVLAGLLRMIDSRGASLDDGAPHHPASAPPSTGSGKRRARSAGSWAIAALAYLSVQVLSTISSVAPRNSFWGSFTRLQGLYTTAAYVVVFLTVLAFCRSRSQIERIIQACLLTSVPVSLYGIIQRFGTDPVPWMADVVRRPGSTMGNPIFLAAFVMMVVPLALYRYLEVGRVVTRDQTRLIKWVFIGGGIVNILFQLVAWSRGPVSGSLAAMVTLGLWTAQGHVFSRPLRPFVRTGVYSVLLSAQLAAIMLSGSRGPLLALLVGLSAFVALWALTRGKRRWLAATTAVVAAVFITLILLNHPASPLRRFEPQTPSAVRRFTHLLEGSGRVRLLLWEGAAGLVGQDPARFVWGYGPESEELVLSKHVPAELDRVEEGMPDRSHNETFDVLVTTGLLGLAAYAVLFTAMLVTGLRWAGAARTRDHRRSAAAICLVGAGSAMVAARVLDGSWRFSGLALPAGMLGGVLIYLAGLRPWRRAPLPRWCNTRLLAVLIFSALVAHFVEIQVGIAITATRTYFWIYLALIAGALAGLHGPGTRAGVGARRQTAAASPGSPLVPSLMSILVLLTLVFDLVPAKESSVPTVLWLGGSSWLLAAIMLSSESRRGSPGSDLKEGLVIYAALPLLTVSIFAALHRLPALLIGDPTLTPVPFYIALLIVVVAIAIGLTRGRRPPTLASSRFGAPAGVGLGIVAMILIVTTNVDVVRADIALKQAQSHFSRPGQLDEAERWALTALAIRPSRDHLHTVLGQIRTRRAETTGGSDQRESTFARAEESFLTAHDLSPLRAANSTNLARLYRSWAERTPNEESKRALFDRALSCYRNALDRDPSSFRTWNEVATIHLLAGRISEAEAVLEHSLALNDAFSATYVDRGRVNLMQGKLGDALQSFQRAVSLDTESAEALQGLALTYARLGRAAEAARSYENLLALRPADLDAHVQLARIYAVLDRPDLASARAQAALKLAPPGRRSAIEQLVGEFLIKRPARSE
ncbi:MAG: O-antigen ligase family protein [Acidobacteriota bacterium]|jgi:tetratricopeptide (TPR) repeat protein/O-antigen ligase